MLPTPPAGGEVDPGIFGIQDLKNGKVIGYAWYDGVNTAYYVMHRGYGPPLANNGPGTGYTLVWEKPWYASGVPTPTDFHNWAASQLGVHPTQTSTKLIKLSYVAWP